MPELSEPKEPMPWCVCIVFSNEKSFTDPVNVECCTSNRMTRVNFKDAYLRIAA